MQPVMVSVWGRKRVDRRKEESCSGSLAYPISSLFQVLTKPFSSPDLEKRGLEKRKKRRRGID